MAQRARTRGSGRKDDSAPAGQPAKRPAEMTVEDRLKKAEMPSKEAMRLHPFYRGKIEVSLKTPIRSFDDFAIWYTPGVAAPCRAIVANPDDVYEYTNKGNAVAVVSDGSRVLGLGNIGAEAGLPVMEGKALLYKYLGGVDAYPVCLATQNAEEIISAVKWMAPNFGGVNLEDIAHPKCFTVLDRLRKEANIPIWHDDQQGTATVTLAGVLGALKVVGKRLKESHLCLIGAGAANIAIGRLLIAAGANPKKIIYVDRHGILHPNRSDKDELQREFVEKWKMALTTNAEGRTGDIPDGMRGMDVVVSAAQSGPGVIKPEWVHTMADDSIIFACANPVPEIWPWEAKEAGAKVVATGRSDFPNQVNNSLGFPGIFRGTLDVRARTITDEMCIAASHELLAVAEEAGLSEEAVIARMDDWMVFAREAAAVGMKAIEQGIARKKPSRQQLLDQATDTIKRARAMTASLVKDGLIRMPPPAPPS